MEKLSFVKDEKLKEYQWPVIVYKRNYMDVEEYKYPKSIFENIRMSYNIYLYSGKKYERLETFKKAIDMYINNEINIHIYHLIFNSIYGIGEYLSTEDITEENLGKKRFNIFKALPLVKTLSNDDFLSEIWSNIRISQNEDYEENIKNPYLNKVRILFTPEQLEHYTGRLYFDIDWLEPIPGARDLECNKYTEEVDPMKIKDSNKDYKVGPILLGTDGNGLRHFVNGEPIHAGIYIEVRFGKGWLPGRYEWSYSKEQPIQIHNAEQVIFIKENHLVRLKK